MAISSFILLKNKAAVGKYQKSTCNSKMKSLVCLLLEQIPH
ncbi:hypothetical protein F544_10030 [Bibersteinia trehalosi USDA-ARS-USMARC-190]|uniref:Uncharacterized protein n=1 Tax=Bibersteinia trehalosi USDA-ARS-USMARC-190 TaxID=1263832 RepID=W0R722_BIBTR|nr:hypothetical protein F544_10030 [Bibersteinia trehalosi USDA-ARS-USMARC-190]